MNIQSSDMPENWSINFSNVLSNHAKNFFLKYTEYSLREILKVYNKMVMAFMKPSPDLYDFLRFS